MIGSRGGFDESLRVGGNLRPGVVMHGHRHLRFQEVERGGGIFDPHGRVVSDRHHRDVEAEFSDELHVEKERSIAGMIDRLAIGLDNETARAAEVDRIQAGLHARGVKCNRELDAAERESECPARIHAVGLGALGGEVLGDLVIGDNRGATALRQVQRIARVVLVAVRAKDVVNLEVGGLDRRERIAGEKRIDDQAGFGGLKEEAGMGEIGDFHGQY